MSIQTYLSKKLPTVGLRLINRLGLYKNFVPGKGKVQLGDLRGRLIPFSKNFGKNRGGAVDRYYIEKFLGGHKNFIFGRVLEVGNDTYTSLFGQHNVSQIDILHIDNSNPKATFQGDLSDCPSLPDNSFDCIILTQTLQYVYEAEKAIGTCYRILKPGGVLLLTVPGISPISKDDWSDKWCWMFTKTAIIKMLRHFFHENEISVEGFGNVLVSTAFLYGMGASELKREELAHNDLRYHVVISAKAVKS